MCMFVQHIGLWDGEVRLDKFYIAGVVESLAL